MEIGIIGLPLSGKSTIFSTLLKHKDLENSESRHSAERGIVKVPDARLNHLTAIFKPKKEIHTTIEYLKVPGFDGDAKQGQGLPSKFLTNLKNVDALLIVVRNFENEFYPHPFNKIDPAADIEYINSEFLLSDLLLVESRYEKLDKLIKKTQDEKDKRELALIVRLKKQLDNEKPLRELEFSENELLLLRAYQFITTKPILYVVNISEDQTAAAEEIELGLQQYVTENCSITTLSAVIEKEISELEEEDAREFMEDLNIQEPALNKLIRSSYELLGLISFFTVGDDECRSWTIRRGTKAKKAAGVIHSDLEKGFIRAETVHYDTLIEQGGSLAACKEKGLLHQEGKDYIVQDGDILNILFNI